MDGIEEWQWGQFIERRDVRDFLTGVSGDTLIDGLRVSSARGEALSVDRSSGSATLSPSEPVKARVVRNSLLRANIPGDSAFSQFASGDGAIAVAPDNKSVTCSLSGAGGRAWLSRTFTYEAGKVYAFSCRFELTGDPTGGDNIIQFSGSTPDAGASSALYTSAGRIALVFSFNAETIATIRMGLGINSNRTQTTSVTVSEWMIEELESVSDAPSEYVPPGLSSAFGYEKANTINSGLVIESQGASLGADVPRTLLIIGDSFNNEDTENAYILEGIDPRWSVACNAFSGRSLQEGIALVASSHDLSAVQQQLSTGNIDPDYHPNALPASYVAGMLSVNDINAGASLSDLQIRVADFVAEVAGLSGSPLCILTTCPPFGALPAHNETKEAVRSSFNAWLRSYVAATDGVRLFDIARVLEDPADSTLLRSDLDSGDGIHPNPKGSDLIARALIEELERFHVPSLEFSANKTDGWSLRFDHDTGRATLRRENGAGGSGLLTMTGDGIGLPMGSALPSLDSTSRDNLSFADGALIYNETTNKVQARANGSWVDLH